MVKINDGFRQKKIIIAKVESTDVAATSGVLISAVIRITNKATEFCFQPRWINLGDFYIQIKDRKRMGLKEIR